MAPAQNQVATEQTVLLRLGDEVEMGNSVFRVDLVVPNPLEDDETTTAIDDDEIAMLKDEDMGVPMPNHEVHDIEDDDDDLDVDDQVEDAHLPVDEAEDDEADSDDHVIPLSVTSTRFAYHGPEQRRRERASERGRGAVQCIRVAISLRAHIPLAHRWRMIMRVPSRLGGHGVLADLVWTLAIVRWRIKAYVTLRRKGTLPWCEHYDRKMESKSREPLAPPTQFSHTHFATTTWPSHSTHSPHTILKLFHYSTTSTYDWQRHAHSANPVLVLALALPNPALGA